MVISHRMEKMCWLMMMTRMGRRWGQILRRRQWRGSYRVAFSCSWWFRMIRRFVRWPLWVNMADETTKEKIEVDKRQFRLQPGFQPRQSVWRRKITPPKISVKDLISKFKNSPEAEDPEELCLPARVVPTRKVVDPRKKTTNISLTVLDRLLPPLASPDRTTVFASARTAQFANGT